MNHFARVLASGPIRWRPWTQATLTAAGEADRLILAAKAEVDQETHRAREVLRKQVATLDVAGAEKVLAKSIDAKTHGELLEKLAAEL